MIQQSGPGLDGKKGDVALAKAIDEDEVESIIHLNRETGFNRTEVIQ